MILLLVVTMLAAAAGAVAGGVTAGLVIRRWRNSGPDEDPALQATDEWTAAEIDRAAAAWAESHGRPEAASMLADKLHLLHRLAVRRQKR